MHPSYVCSSTVFGAPQTNAPMCMPQHSKPFNLHKITINEWVALDCHSSSPFPGHGLTTRALPHISGSSCMQGKRACSTAELCLLVSTAMDHCCRPLSAYPLTNNGATKRSKEPPATMTCTHRYRDIECGSSRKLSSVEVTALSYKFEHQ